MATAVVPDRARLCRHTIADTVATVNGLGGLAGAAWGVLVVGDCRGLTNHATARALLDIFHRRHLVLQRWLPDVLHRGQLN